MKALLAIFRVMAARQWLWLLAGMTAGILVIGANVALMAVSGWFIASMAVAGVSKAAFNFAIPAVAIRALAIFRTLGRYVDRLVNHEAAFRMLSDLRSWLFEALVPLAPAGLERYAGADVTGRLRADVDNMENLYLRLFAPIVTGIAIMVLAPMFLSLWSQTAATALFTGLFAAGVLLPAATGKMAQKPGEQVVKLGGELRVAVTEGLQGAEELLLLGASVEQAVKVEALYAEIARGQRRLGSINGAVTGGVITVAGLLLASILYTATAEVSSGVVTGPVMVMLLMFSAASFEGVSQMASALQALPATTATAGRLNEFAVAPCPVPESLTPAVPASGCDIVFSGVSFAYGDGLEVLSDFSMTVAEGSCVALSGNSGAGKSSIIEILLRFRPYRGSITIGGVELRDISTGDMPSLVTAVPQRPHLFNSSIRDNVLLGFPDADSSRIRQVLEDSALYDWIQSLPEGIDTLAGVAGSKVSGGEAKRIALARALLHDAPIILLDEPTEGLDRKMELAIVERLKICLQGKTVILTSHRTPCLALADRLVKV